MPGIFGLIDKKRSDRTSENTWYPVALNIMAQVMSYETSYSSSTQNFSELGVYLGSVWHLTNPINEVSKNENGLSLFLSNWDSIDLENLRPVKKETIPNVQSIFNHYQNVSFRFPKFINGISSGVLVDEKLNKCFIFNDHFGIERLFLYEDDEKIAFSSEAKAILAIIEKTRDFDPVGLGEFFASGTTFGENSLFRRIKILPPSSVVTLAKGMPPQQTIYADYTEMEKLDPISKESDFVEEFSEKLKLLVRKSTQVPGRAGISLTGGLDSRMIMACLNPSNKLTCYTFGSIYKENYDVKIASEVAKECMQAHKTLVLDKNFLDAFETYLNKSVFISDGYFGFYGAGELYVNSQARNLAPLRITGNYGSELIRGARAFKSSMPKGRFLRPELLNTVNHAIHVFNQKTIMNPTTFTLTVQAPSAYGRYAIERSQVSLFTPFLDQSLVELIYKIPVSFRQNKDPSYEIIKTLNRKLLSIATDRGLLGYSNPISQLVTRLFRETTFKMEYWTDQGMPKRLNWLPINFDKSQLAEQLFLGRHKFQHYGTWSRNQLSEFIATTLDKGDNTKLNKYINFDAVKEMLTQHHSAKNNFINEIDRIITLTIAEKQLFGIDKNVKSVK